MGGESGDIATWAGLSLSRPISDGLTPACGKRRVINCAGDEIRMSFRSLTGNYFLAMSSSIGPHAVVTILERTDLNPTRSMESAM